MARNNDKFQNRIGDLIVLGVILFWCISAGAWSWEYFNPFNWF